MTSQNSHRVLSTLKALVMCLLISFLIIFFSGAWAKDIYSFPSAQEHDRFIALSQELRCLVCQNQSLADSDATLAKDLRAKIYLMIQEKKTDQEIKQFLVERYGDFILFLPPVKSHTLILWGFPFILLSFIFIGLVMRRAH